MGARGRNKPAAAVEADWRSASFALKRSPHTPRGSAKFEVWVHILAALTMAFLTSTPRSMRCDLLQASPGYTNRRQLALQSMNDTNTHEHDGCMSSTSPCSASFALVRSRHAPMGSAKFEV
eukprot:4009558-Pyramimonas_sp.AAC.1